MELCKAEFRGGTCELEKESSVHTPHDTVTEISMSYPFCNTSACHEFIAEKPDDKMQPMP
jgi:hypothetical protein